jgi:WD40 repeat protein
MIGRKTFWLRRASTIATLVFAAFAGQAPGLAAGLDPAQMSADAIKALEQRLTDAGCYKGTIDGTTSSALDDAIKACPDQRPFLRIETGMHTAPIWRIGVDAGCRLLATGSEDKTIRLWSSPEGKLKKIIRLPIGERDIGKIYAIALSPNGDFLAAGGRNTTRGQVGEHYLTLINLSSGFVRRVGAYNDVIHRLRFSVDGNRLAVGLGGESGVRVLDSATGTELLADRNYGDSVYGLAFSPDGALVTSSDDGQLRRYEPDLKLTVKHAAPDGKDPITVTANPSGDRIAVGYSNNMSVSILDAKTLVLIAKAQTSDIAGVDFESAAWSRDGHTLVAGGRAMAQFGGEWQNFIRRFHDSGEREGADIAASGDTILDIQSCGEGFVFAAGDPAFGLLSPQGDATTLQGPRTANMRGKRGSAFALSPDASSVRFGLGEGEARPVVFDLATASLTDSPNLPAGFAPARVEGLPVTDWDSDEPKFNGAKLALENYETSRALAIRSGASGFVLGSDYWVRAYNAKGEERWKQPGLAAWGVDFSAAGEITAVAYYDGTIRWLRWSDGAELLAFFVEPQSRKWVAWTPSGYYMASAGGEDLIGWHVNRGWNQEADFFPASQFRAQYNRPDIVRLVLTMRDEGKAIAEANAKSGRSPAKSVAATLPPIVGIASPTDGAHFSGDSIEIAYSLRSPSGLPIDRLDVLADGQPVEAKGFAKTTAPTADGRVIVTPPQKETKTISLIAYSGGLTSGTATVKLIDDRKNIVQAPDPRPRLYALLVGVTKYEDKDLDSIFFGGRDAEDLAEALERQKGGLYADVQTKIVDFPTSDKIASKTIGPPTRENLFKGLYWLSEMATDRDLSIVFLSGHGYRDFNGPKPKFWFLTRDADLKHLPTTAISGDELLTQIFSLAGKKILFIDACYAGADVATGAKASSSNTLPNMDDLVNDFTTAGSGIVVYSASQASELANENEKWDRHGAFAKALIEAIGQGKGANPAGRITTDLLDFYVSQRVKELTEGHQHPIWNHPDPVSDFPVALMRQ